MMEDAMTQVTINSWGLIVCLAQKGSSVLSALHQTPIAALS